VSLATFGQLERRSIGEIPQCRLGNLLDLGGVRAEGGHDFLDCGWNNLSRHRGGVLDLR
jgi:hypothetical protein